MECYICDEEMEYIETLVVSQLGMVRHYICHNCGEEVYEPIRDNKIVKEEF